MAVITITVDLNEAFIQKVKKANHLFDLSSEEVTQVITTFLNDEVGTQNGLLMLINNIDLFNY